VSFIGEPCILHIIGHLMESQHSLPQRCGIKYEDHADINGTEMHQAYVDADVKAFISVAEGFGLPDDPRAGLGLGP
jgi:hypothetical protein